MSTTIVSPKQLGIGTPSSLDFLRGDGSWATLTAANIPNASGDVTGPYTGLTVVATQGLHWKSGATYTNGQVPTWNSANSQFEPGNEPVGTVTSVSLAMPAIFSVSGSPVTTSGTLTATLASVSANQVFAGPASGSAAAPTFRALAAADLAGSPGTNQYLQYDGSALVWSTVSGGGGSPAGSNTQIQFNNSGSFGASSNFVWNNGLAVTMPSTSTQGIKITGIASQTANFMTVTDSGSTNVFSVGSTGAVTVLLNSGNAAISAKTSGGAAQSLQTSTAPTSGGRLGIINFAGVVSATTLNGAEVAAYGDGTWTSSSAPTYLSFTTCPSGTTTGVERLRIDNAGNLIPNMSGAQLSTSATNGFVNLPNMAGNPTGTPGTYTGNSPVVADTTNGAHWTYFGSNWVSNGPGRHVVTKTADYTMTPQDDQVNMTGSHTVTLFAGSSAIAGKMYVVLGSRVGAGTTTVTISCAGSDTFIDGTTTITLSVGAGTTHTAGFCWDGSNWNKLWSN